jgi:hypothetical protein
MSWAQQAEITERAFDRSRVARGEGEQVGRLVAMVVVAVLVCCGRSKRQPDSLAGGDGRCGAYDTTGHTGAPRQCSAARR